MNLNQLHYFVTLAHMEHYTNAAQKLSITQPSLSHAISSLEEELGTSLFERQGRNVALTKYGRLFMEYAEEALDILDAGIKKTRAMTSERSGKVDIGYIYTQGSEFIPEVISGFLEANRDKKVEFGFSNGVTKEIVEGVKEEKYDIGFCSMVTGEKELDFVPVSQEKLIAAVPPEHPLAEKKSVRFEEIASYPQIFFNRGSGLRGVISQIFKDYGIKPDIVYTVDEDSAMVGLVARGFGVGIVPDAATVRSMKASFLEIEDLDYRRFIYMVTLKNKYQVPVAKAFTEYVKDYYSLKK
ncbi:LysR family transcriptional regulator [[Clostridium] hylemonae]|nr:LysR family transcriptional regulator [[Clostridium] hylemonae]MCB7520875.1 LysR family transcriptional regulator [[Clostridium] hylemonae]QEK18182.1 HTH-type transcriptional regulator GltC [[Clostridium] hylemonae DSM 15053]BDF05196.1 LysR family transcriptional regulator [[Clostridium] hylemonae]